MRIPQRRSSLASLALALVIVSVLAALAALALTAGGIQAQAAAPTGLAGSVSHDSVSLTWEDPGDDSVTGYRVLRRSRDGDGDEYGDGGGAAECVAAIDDSGSPAASYTDTLRPTGTHISGGWPSRLSPLATWSTSGCTGRT